MHLETLRAELERLFELEELRQLGRDVLDLEPGQIGGEAATASFIKALTERCVADDAVEALCDAIAAAHEYLDPRLVEVRTRGYIEPEELESGTAVGPYVIAAKLGEGPRATVYRAHHDGAEVRLKLLRPEAAVDRRGLQRYLTASRLVADADHPSIPTGVVAGRFDDRYVVAQDYAAGVTLAQRLAEQRTFRFEEAWPLLRQVLDALSALHARHLAHGALHAENVLIIGTEPGEEQVLLLDAGAAHVRLTSAATAHQADRLGIPGSPKTVAPEQLRGRVADPRSDVYSFGALLYELLSGKAPFAAQTALDAIAGHLLEEPKRLSAVVPHEWFLTQLDDLVGRLLEKDPAHRVPDAHALLKELDAIARASMATMQVIDEEEVQERIRQLLENPFDDDLAARLEAAVGQGADAQRIAEAFRWVAEQLGIARDPIESRAQRRLLAHAAHLYEGPGKALALAEGINQQLLESDPGDESARAALMRIRRRLGKFEDLVEMLLEQSQAAQSAGDRARALGEIGSIYANELEDVEQAVVAYSQAFCEDPHERSYAAEVERLAGNSYDAWNEALSGCVEATQAEDLSPEVKNRLFVQMGRWYADKVSRPDLALPCFQAVVQVEPSNAIALEGMAAIYRRAQQWNELGMVLMTHADAAATPGQARDLRAEAADLLYYKLNDPDQARNLYEQVLAEDPSHAQANQALAKIYEAAGNLAGYVRTLEQQVSTLKGEEKNDLLCRVGELYEDQLDDVEHAIARYEKVVAQDPGHLDALRGLDRCFSKTAAYPKLLANLELQLQVAATPRQKVGLYERIAGLYDEEFLDHAKAIEACEALLDIEPTHDTALTQLGRHFRALERWADFTVVTERHLDLITDEARRVDVGLALAKVLSEHLRVPERAIDVYEQVLGWAPENREALDALAGLRAAEGDAEAALQAMESLAQKADTPEAKAAQYVRAGELLDQRGDLDRAIESYKRAMDAHPQDRHLWATLRGAYQRKGDHGAAADLLQREIGETEGERARAQLCGQLARLYFDSLADELRADAFAQRALNDDPTNLEALTVLGDIAFDSDQFVVASKHYEQVVKHTDALDLDESLRIHVAYMEALVQSGEPKRGLEVGEQLLELSPTDFDIHVRVAELSFEEGSDERTYDLYRELLARFEEQLTGGALAVARYRLGEAARRFGDIHTALDQLQQAAELDPEAPAPLRSLAKLYQDQERWADAIRVMYDLIDFLMGDERVALLIEIGDLAAAQMHDSDYAAESYLSALSDRPDDRKVLMKLMQLYSEEKDWQKLVEIILKLSELVDSGAQQAKYLVTAAKVCSRELGENARAAELFERALALDETQDRALEEALTLRREAGEWEAVKTLLKERIKLASKTQDRGALLGAMDELGRLYDEQFGQLAQAVAVQEEAAALDGDNVDRQEALTQLYLRDIGTYFDKALALQIAVLDRDPYRAEAYRALRGIYTKRKLPDATWCTCQALFAINRAAPDETMFYKRLRPEGAAVVQGRLAEADWDPLVVHPSAEPLLTALFALIQPAIASVQAESLEQLGYTAGHQLFPDRDPYMLAQILHYVAEALGVDPPPLYQNTNDQGGVSFLHAQTPSLVLGQMALAVDTHSQEAAFVAARQVTYFRPGLYVRHLVPTGTGLKAWLFAAIKSCTPAFPIAADLQGEVGPALGALEREVVGAQRDRLARVVTQLVQSGAALDLKKWVAAMDLTADRVGLIMSHDLQTTVSQIRASGDAATSVPVTERLKHILRYSVSEPFFEVRRRLGITVDA